MSLTPCLMAGIAILLIGLFFPGWYGNHEGRNDAKKIFRDGTANSLRDKWHRHNFTRRFVIIGIAAIIVQVLLWWLLEFNLWFFPLYFTYGWALCFYVFTPTVNQCRRPPKAKWYVSYTASNTDRFFVTGSRKWNQWAAAFQLKYGLEWGWLTLTPEQFSRFCHTAFLVISSAGLVGYLLTKYLV